MTAFDTSGLGLSTTKLMSLGGDDRITLDEQSGLNSYGCAPKPTGTLGYSSSTASFIGAAAYAHASSLHHQLRAGANAGDDLYTVYERFLGQSAARLRDCYGLGQGTDIAFGPSGTDLEYIALACALEVSPKVCNIVVEVDEVGSGCQFSQAGRYFAPRTALGQDVEKGELLAGIKPGSVRVETVRMRGDTGEVASEEAYAGLLDKAVRDAISRGERPLLHVVHRSKTGLVLPSWPVLNGLVETHGDGIDVVVDACQARISPQMVGRYLDLNAIVLLTGSKFIGGPPFSGFAIFAPGVAGRMRDASSMPEGLGAFFSKAELPSTWGASNALKPIPNFGLLLRLEAGIFELERLLAAAPERVEAVIETLRDVMHSLPGGSPFELHTSATSGTLAAATGHPFDCQSLFVIVIKPEILAKCPIDFEEARAIYRMLYSDLSDRFDDPADKLVAADICHLGQPVRCLRRSGEWQPTFRISLSAGQIFDLSGMTRDGLETRLRSDITRIGEKISLAINLLMSNRALAELHAQ